MPLVELMYASKHGAETLAAPGAARAAYAVPYAVIEEAHRTGELADGLGTRRRPVSSSRRSTDSPSCSAPA